MAYTKVKSSYEYMTAKYDLLTFKCVHDNKTNEEKVEEDLSKRFGNTYQFLYYIKVFVNMNKWLAGLGKIQ